MASEFVADSAERIVTIARSLGVSMEVAGKIANEWQAGVIADWGGERAYVGKANDRQRAASRLRLAVTADYRAGERPPAIARKHGISVRTVWRLVGKV